ncbi:MAG: hypothetical protein J0H53_26050 [Rhizobiales bacterium]|nr:hypothetical protein [Hyphomicrobiales bacterium]
MAEAGGSRIGRRRGFVAARLAGEVPAGGVFWTDMLAVGTAVNVVAAFAAILMLGFKHPAWVAVCVYLSPLPYNIFLVVAVWRAAARLMPSPAAAYRLGATLWLAVATLV